MSRYWHSVLVPDDPRFIPPPAAVQDFFQRVEAMGAFAGPVQRRLVDHETATRPLEATSAIAGAIGAGRRWRVELGSEGAGPRPPIAPVVTADSGSQTVSGPYGLAVACHSFGTLVSTCDVHPESRDPREVGRYGEPCGEDQRIGLFSHPYRPELVLEVPFAGCASFVIEFWLGRSVLPPPDMKSLDLIAPDYVAAAREAFRVEFAQGCHWG